jgi:hypothetical protein
VGGVRHLAAVGALAVVAVGCASSHGARTEAVNEPAPAEAIVGGLFIALSCGSGGTCISLGASNERPQVERIPAVMTPIRIVARLHRVFGDADLAMYRTTADATCFAVVAGYPRCTGDRGCGELCADEWFDAAGRGVLAGLAPMRATTLRVFLDGGAVLTDRLDGPTLGPFPRRRRIFMLDLGRRGYRRVEALDAEEDLVAAQANPS